MVPRPKKTGRLSDPSGLLPRTRRTRAPHLEPANRGKVEERRRDTSDSEHGRAHGRPRSSRKTLTPACGFIDDYKPRRGDNRPARDLWLDDTAYLADRRLHLVAGDLQDELLAGFGAHAARVSLHAGRQITGGKPQQAHFFAWYTPVRAALPPQVAHPVNSGFFVSMPTRRPFSVPT